MHFCITFQRAHMYDNGFNSDITCINYTRQVLARLPFLLMWWLCDEPPGLHSGRIHFPTCQRLEDCLSEEGFSLKVTSLPEQPSARDRPTTQGQTKADPSHLHSPTESSESSMKMPYSPTSPSAHSCPFPPKVWTPRALPDNPAC